jgi:uncharacterized protein YozE (UPF0346 family)
MLISDKHNFIFIHVWKVAGTSITKALEKYAYNPDKYLPKLILKKAGVKSDDINQLIESVDRYGMVSPYAGLRRHARAKQVKQRLTAQKYDKFYTFAFVRNPWDWEVSFYHYVLSRKNHAQHEQVKAMGNFEKYIEWKVNSNIDLQKNFVTDDSGKVIVDFIGRYENLSEDFQIVCDKLNLNASLPHANKSQRKTYQKYYNPHTRKVLEECYQEDIEFFNYTF